MGSVRAQRAPCESRDTLHACGGTVVSARSVLVHAMCLFVHQGVTMCFSLCCFPACVCVVESRGREKRMLSHILTPVIYCTLHALRVCV